MSLAFQNHGVHPPPRFWKWILSFIFKEGPSVGFPLETLPAQMGQVLPNGALKSRDLLDNHHALNSLDGPAV